MSGELTGPEYVMLSLVLPEHAVKENKDKITAMNNPKNLIVERFEYECSLIKTRGSFRFSQFSR